MAKKKRKPPEKKSNLNLMYAALAFLLIVVMALYFSSASERPQEKLPSAGEYVKMNTPTTYEPGIVKIIEFLKFDCSHCYDLHKNLPVVLGKYGDSVQITYVPIVWPGQSTRSIEAYIIADKMGKGEEMRDALFQANFEQGMDVMESELALKDVAASIGLDEEFDVRLESGAERNAALANIELMNKYGVQGTPTIVVNGNLQVTPSIINIDTVIGSLLS